MIMWQGRAFVYVFGMHMLCVCAGTYMPHHACGDQKIPQVSLPSTLFEIGLFVVSHGILQASCSLYLDTQSQVLMLSL